MVGHYSRFDRLPAVFPGGGLGPLQTNVLRAIETPELYRVGIGPAHVQRVFGADIGTYGPGWGIDEYDTPLDAYRETKSPSESSEVVRWIDVQRSVEVRPRNVGDVWEVAGFALEGSSVGVIERLETFLRIECLSPGGALLATGVVDGSRPWQDTFSHPDPSVAPLEWVWSLSYRAVATRPYCGSQSAGYAGPAPGTTPSGRPLLPNWCDARYGASREQSAAQVVCPARSRVRLSCFLRGSNSRYRVRVVGRIIGYKQNGGRREAALRSAVYRN